MEEWNAKSEREEWKMGKAEISSPPSPYWLSPSASAWRITAPLFSAFCWAG
jgi:hypothetical protein